MVKGHFLNEILGGRYEETGTFLGRGDVHRENVGR